MRIMLKLIIVALIILNILTGWNLYKEHKANEKYERDRTINYLLNQKTIYGFLEESLKGTKPPLKVAKDIKIAYACCVGENYHLPTSLYEFGMDGSMVMGEEFDNAIDGELTSNDIDKLKVYNEWLEKFLKEVDFDFNNYEANDMGVIKKNIIHFGEEYQEARYENKLPFLK